MVDETTRPDAPLDLTNAELHRRLIAMRANAGYPQDGSGGKPLVLQSYTVATVPAAADYTGAVIYVSDETGGATVAFSDGTNWRRVQDRAIIA